jgi:hypothetical protein
MFSVRIVYYIYWSGRMTDSGPQSKYSSFDLETKIIRMSYFRVGEMNIPNDFKGFSDRDILWWRMLS